MCWESCRVQVDILNLWLGFQLFHLSRNLLKLQDGLSAILHVAVFTCTCSCCMLHVGVYSDSVYYLFTTHYTILKLCLQSCIILKLCYSAPIMLAHC